LQTTFLVLPRVRQRGIDRYYLIQYNVSRLVLVIIIITVTAQDIFTHRAHILINILFYQIEIVSKNIW